jgi:hypothetical protein
MPSKFIVAAAVLSLLAIPAHAQAPGSSSSSSSSNVGVPFNLELPPSQEELDRRKAVDHDYNAAMQKIPEKKNADPWGDVRSSAPTKKAKNNNN